MPRPRITDVEIAVLQVIKRMPGADARTVKKAAGLTEDHPRYYKVIPSLTLSGLIWSRGPVGWEPSAKGKALLAEVAKGTTAAGRQWDDHPVIKPDAERRRGRPRSRPHLRLV